MHDEERVLTKRQSYWLKHVRAWQASDKSIAEYSSDQGFTAQAMYAGKKEININKHRHPKFKDA